LKIDNTLNRLLLTLKHLTLNISVILANPGINSFNHIIAETCWKKLTENGHSTNFHDLYAEKFDPVLNSSEIPKNGEIDEKIEEHCKEIQNSDGIIIIHPNWWGMPPAILKGWIDRVLRPGMAYEFIDGDNGEGIPVGLLKAETALVFNTSNTSEQRENEIFKDPLETIWKNCIFDLCGVKQFERRMFRIMVTSPKEQREQWLSEVELMVDKYFPT
jgi:NAD(P)H dehydrogenase (quinone)